MLVRVCVGSCLLLSNAYTAKIKTIEVGLPRNKIFQCVRWRYC